MKTAQAARQMLKGNWLTAITVQCLTVTTGVLTILAEIMAMKVIGLDSQVVFITDLWNGKWQYGAILAGMLILDWLLLSPLLLGRAAFFWNVSAGKDEPDFTLLFSYFCKRYGKALHWRFSLFLRRIWWEILCYMPAAFLWACAGWIHRYGTGSLVSDLTLTLCTVFGFLSLIGGFIGSEMLMMRYLPAAYLLAGNPEKGSRNLFRESRRIMRGHVGEMAWLYAGFSGWLLACVLLLPYFCMTPLFQTTRAIAIRRYITGEDQIQSERNNPQSSAYQARHFSAGKRKLIKD